MFDDGESARPAGNDLQHAAPVGAPGSSWGRDACGAAEDWAAVLAREEAMNAACLERAAASTPPPPSPADLEDPHEQVTWARAAAGRQGAAALAVLDLSAVDDAGVLEAVACSERLSAYAFAVQADALREWGRRHGVYDHSASDHVTTEEARPGELVPGEFAADEVAARCRWTVPTAIRRLEESTWLTSCLPDTLAALHSGRLDPTRARVVVRATQLLDPEDARTVDALLHRRHGPGRHKDPADLTSGQLRPVVARIVAAVDAEAVARAAAATRADRQVTCQSLPNSAAELVATGPAEDVLTVMTALDQAADRDRSPDRDGSRRGVDARRFDALLGWAQRSLDPTGAGEAGCERSDDQDAGRRGSRASIQITVAASTLLGLDDQPGELAGYGPLPSDVVRRIAADGTWRRLFTDPVSGVLVGVDGHTYPPGWVAGGSSAPDGPPSGGSPTDGPPPSGGSPVAGAPPAGDSPPGTESPGGVPATDGPGPAERPHPVRDQTRGGSPSTARCARPPTTNAAGARGCPVAAAGGGRYRPGRPMLRFVLLRDARCTAPGCRLPARLCDVDHVVPHPVGPTCPCNLQPLCRRHHRLKHLGGWALNVDPQQGTTAWTTPAGLTRTTEREAVLPRVALPRRWRTVATLAGPTLERGFDSDHGGLRDLAEAVEAARSGPGACGPDTLPAAIDTADDDVTPDLDHDDEPPPF